MNQNSYYCNKFDLQNRDVKCSPKLLSKPTYTIDHYSTNDNYAEGVEMMYRLKKVRETLNLLRLRLELEKKQLEEEKREAGIISQNIVLSAPHVQVPALPAPTVLDLPLALSTPIEEKLKCQLMQKKSIIIPSLSYPQCQYSPRCFANPMIHKYYNNLQTDRYNIAYYSCRNLAAAAAYREHLERVDKMCNQEYKQVQKSLGCLKQVKKIVDTYSGNGPPTNTNYGGTNNYFYNQHGMAQPLPSQRNSRRGNRNLSIDSGCYVAGRRKSPTLSSDKQYCGDCYFDSVRYINVGSDDSSICISESIDNF